MCVKSRFTSTCGTVHACMCLLEGVTPKEFPGCTSTLIRRDQIYVLKGGWGERGFSSLCIAKNFNWWDLINKKIAVKF